MLRSGGGRGRRSRGGDRLGMEAVVLVPSCVLSDVLETSSCCVFHAISIS